MNPSLRALAFMLFCATAVLGTPAFAEAQQSSKPLLSEEIRRVLEADGPEAAERRFSEIYPAQAEQYEIDMAGMAQLGVTLGQKNDMAAMEAVVRMMGVLQQGLVAQYMPEGARQLQEQEAARRAEKERAQESAPPAAVNGPSIPSRDDLARFIGEYGVASKQDREPVPLNIWVYEVCGGYLAASPIWGDTSPWLLTPTGDTSFEASGYYSFEMHFEADAEGDATGLVLEGDDIGTEGSELTLIKPLEDASCTRPWWG